MTMDHRLDSRQYESILKEVRHLNQDVKELKDILLLLVASNIKSDGGIGSMGEAIVYVKQLKEQMLEEKRKELTK